MLIFPNWKPKPTERDAWSKKNAQSHSPKTLFFHLPCSSTTASFAVPSYSSNWAWLPYSILRCPPPPFFQKFFCRVKDLGHALVLPLSLALPKELTFPKIGWFYNNIFYSWNTTNAKTRWRRELVWLIFRLWWRRPFLTPFLQTPENLIYRRSPSLNHSFSSPTTTKTNYWRKLRLISSLSENTFALSRFKI